MPNLLDSDYGGGAPVQRLTTINSFRDYMLMDLTSNWYTELLHAIAYHEVGNRPGRYEPRARKRRPKPYKLLQIPRAEA